MKTHLPLLLAFATLAVPLSAHAATYTVNTTDDPAPIPGTPLVADGTTSGNLRQMILNANASADNDAIIFSVSGTITLASALANLGSGTSGTLSISGSGANVTISGNQAVRIFLIPSSSTQGTTIDNLTLRDATTTGTGAAIASNGSSTIFNCTFINNTTTGSATTSGGPAIAASNATASSTTITNCTFTNNSSSVRGGAIYSNTQSGVTPDRFTVIRNCTFTGNSAAQRGGAIFNSSGLTIIDSSTIAGNSAPQDQGAGVCNSTSAGGTSVTRVQNSIIADNRTIGGGADSGTDLDTLSAQSATFESLGNNAIGDGNAAVSFNNTTAGTADQTNVTAAQIKLDALADNGGPTQTRALVTGSVAIDTGATALTVDQRGTARPVGAAKDIGAYEGSIANRAPRLNNATYTVAVSSAFSQQLAGTDPDSDTLTYALATGSALPAGLTLDSATGIISGTPTTAGRTDFSVTVNDGITPAITSKFIIVVSSATDGVGAVITRGALKSSYTRDQLAALSYTGTIKDVAQSGATVSGVSRLLFQLRQGNTSYSGPTDGFTSNVGRGYYAAFIDTPSPNTPGGDRLFRRTFSTFIPPASVLTPGSYSIVIAAQDVAGNYSVEVVPVTITAPTPPPANGGPTQNGSNGQSLFGIAGSVKTG